MARRRDSPTLSVVIAFFLLLVGQLVTSCDDVDVIASVTMNASPSGFFLGTFTSTGTQPSVNRETIGIISETFDAQFFLSSEHYAGRVFVDGTLLSGTLTEYRGRRGVFLGFDRVSTITLDGEVTERDGIFGDYAGTEDQGRFTLSYDSTYENDSSIELLSGVWFFSQASSGGLLYTITLDIDSTGQLFGTDSAGCVFSGQFNIIDDSYTVYRATIDISSCDEVNGTYSGLALASQRGTTSRMYLGTDNGSFAFASLFDRT